MFCGRSLLTGLLQIRRGIDIFFLLCNTLTIFVYVYQQGRDEMNKNVKPCALYRHQLFRAGYTCCLICNPGVDPGRLARLVRQPGLQAYYEALLTGTECHALKCQKPGIHDDAWNIGGVRITSISAC